MKKSIQSVLETDLLPDGIPDPAQVPALEGPAYPLVDRERGAPATPQQLVRWDDRPAAHLLVVAVVLEIPHAFAVVASVLLSQYLGPVRYVHRERRGRGDPVAVFRFLPPGPSGGDRLAVLGWSGLEGAPSDVGLVELV